MSNDLILSKAIIGQRDGPMFTTQWVRRSTRLKDGFLLLFDSLLFIRIKQSKQK